MINFRLGRRPKSRQKSKQFHMSYQLQQADLSTGIKNGKVGFKNKYQSKVKREMRSKIKKIFDSMYGLNKPKPKGNPSYLCLGLFQKNANCESKKIIKICTPTLGLGESEGGESLKFIISAMY